MSVYDYKADKTLNMFCVNVLISTFHFIICSSDNCFIIYLHAVCTIACMLHGVVWVDLVIESGVRVVYDALTCTL